MLVTYLLPHSICFLGTHFPVVLSVPRLLAPALTADYVLGTVSTQIPKTEHLIGLVYLYLCSAFSCLDLSQAAGSVWLGPISCAQWRRPMLGNVTPNPVIRSSAIAVTADEGGRLYTEVDILSVEVELIRLVQ